MEPPTDSGYGSSPAGVEVHNPRLPFALRVLMHSGDSVVLFPLAAVLAWIAPITWRSDARFALLAMAVAGAAGWLVKQLVRRPRPAGDYGKGYRRYDPYAFPSGHASRTFALATAALLGAPLWFGIGVLTWAIATSWVRVYGRLHYVTDILAGMLLGTACACLLHMAAIRL